MRRYWFLFSLLISLGCWAFVVDNYTDEQGFPRLIPTVHQLERQDGSFAMPNPLKVQVPQGAENEFQTLERGLRARFSSWRAVAVSVKEPAHCSLKLTELGTPENEEGYFLQVSPKGIEVRARTERGLFYGVQTLCRLIHNNSTVRLPSCKITDWPDLPLRGVYWGLRWVRPEHIDKFAKCIDVYGGLKYNTMVIDFGASLPFENSPFVNQKNRLSGADVEKIKEACRRNHIEIIPQIQVLTHEEWLRGHPDYLDKVTARKTFHGKRNATWNVMTCPNSKLGRQLIEYGIKENIRFFKPRYISLSMDEFHLCKWKECQFCQGGHKPEEIIREANHYAEFVKSLGVIPMMYQDAMLPERSENDELAIPLRKGITRDMAIGAWDYAVHPWKRLIKIFQEEGFTDISGVSFCYRLGNTVNLPICIDELGGRGVVLTYWGWIGKFMNDYSSFNCNAAAATTLSADFTWNVRKGLTIADLTWDPANELYNRMPFGHIERRSTHSYQVIPIESLCNGVLGSDGNFPQLRPKQVMEIQQDVAKHYQKFQLAVTENKGIASVLFSGGKEENYYKVPVTVPMHQAKLDGFSLLLTASMPDDPQQFNYFHFSESPLLVNVKIHFTDGTSEVKGVAYRRHVNSWNSDSSGMFCNFVSRGQDAMGRHFSLFATHWNNSKTERTIDSLEFVPQQNTGVALALLGIVANGYKGVAPKAGKLSQVVENQRVIEIGNGRGEKMIFDARNGFLPRGTKVHFESIEPAAAGRYGFVKRQDGKRVFQCTLPPQKAGTRWARFYMDVPVEEGVSPETLLFDYCVDNPGAVTHSGVYRGTAEGLQNHDAVFGFGYNAKGDLSLGTASFCGKIIHEGTQCPAEKTRYIRFSLWFKEYGDSVTIQIANIRALSESYKSLNAFDTQMDE